MTLVFMIYYDKFLHVFSLIVFICYRTLMTLVFMIFYDIFLHVFSIIVLYFLEYRNINLADIR